MYNDCYVCNTGPLSLSQRCDRLETLHYSPSLRPAVGGQSFQQVKLDI